MAGSYKQLQLKSLNTLSDDDAYIDGSCVVLDNLEPKGVESNPKWVPSDSHLLKHDTNFNDSGTTKVKVFHVSREGLNTKFDSSSRSGADYFLVCEKKNSSNRVTVSTTTNATLPSTDKNKLVQIIDSPDSTHSKPDMQAFSLRDDQQFILINENVEGKHNPQDFDPSKSKMFMSKGDKITTVVPPTFPNLTVSHSTEDFSIETFEKGFPLGDYPGILANRDRFIGVVFAYKAPSGEYIKQTAPYIHKIDGLFSGGTVEESVKLTCDNTSTTNFDPTSHERFQFNGSAETPEAGQSDVEEVTPDTTSNKFVVTSEVQAQIRFKFKIMSRTFASGYSSSGASFRIKITKGGITDSAPIIYQQTISTYHIYGISTGTVITVHNSSNINLEAGDYYAVLDDIVGFSALSVRMTEFELELTTPATNLTSVKNRVATLKFKANGNNTGDIHSDTTDLNLTYDRILGQQTNNFNTYYESDKYIKGNSFSHLDHHKIKEFFDLSGVHILITTPKDTFDDALNEGTYYHIANFSETSDSGVYEFKDNESLIVTKEVMNNDPFSHHNYNAYNMKKALNRVWLMGLVTDFAPPQSAFYPGFLAHTSDGNESNTVLNYNSEEDINPSASSQTYNKPLVAYITVTINVDGKEFKRTTKTHLKGFISGSTKISKIPHYLAYPDRRATKIEFIATHNSSYQQIEYDLIKHPFLNIAYNYSQTERFTTAETSGVSVPSVSTAATNNSNNLYEPGKVRVSSIDGFTFPLQQTYEVDDMAITCTDNIQEASQSSFGRYPVTLFCQNKIYGFEFGDGGVLFRKVMLISDDYGAHSRESVTTMRGSIFFLDKNAMYILNGNSIQEAHRPIEDLKTPSISHGNESDQFAITIGGTSFFDTIFGDSTGNFGSPALFSDPNKNRLYIYRRQDDIAMLIYDTRYNCYYTSSQSYRDLFFVNSTPYGFKVESNTLKLYSLHDKDSSVQSMNIKMATDFMPFDSTFNYKKLLSSVLQIAVNTESNKYVRISLQGKRSTHSSPTTLIKITVGKSNASVSQDGIYIKSNRGSYQSFRLVIDGDAKITSEIGQTLFNYLPRNAKIKI